jgi:hypothetical protein
MGWSVRRADRFHYRQFGRTRTPMSPRGERCAMMLVVGGVSVIWSGVAWAAIVQLIALH